MSHRHIPTFLLAALLVLLAGAPQPSTETPSPLAAAPLAGASSALAASPRQATTAPTSAGEMFIFLPLVSVGHAIDTVFLIVMENHNWSDIYQSPSAPYINQTLLPQASYAQQYYNPPGIHPSEPNYLWLEAGTDFGIADDNGPSQNHQPSQAHLVTLLSQAGISWKSYQEDITGDVCPLTDTGLYAPKHNPMVFFDDVTDTNDPMSATCIAHMRPYTELATDLQQNTTPRYAFITPNLCHDMHGAGACAPADQVALGDTWLAAEVPKILAAPAYRNNGALLITWDEGRGSDGLIGMIVLSPQAKGGGYTNTIHYTHSSTLRTLQEIFGVTPLLGDAAQATDLGDLFTRFP
jgi:phosphatidylinositol-3-phosphatase